MSDAANLHYPIDLHHFFDIGIDVDKIDNGIRGHYLGVLRTCYSDFTNETLAAIDARLPRTVEAMFDALSTRSDRMPARWLSDTLSYWDNPVELCGLDGNEVCPAYITKIYRMDDTTQSVKIGGYAYDVVEHNGIVFAAGQKWFESTVNYVALDAHYPGWQVRYNVMAALDMPAREMFLAVFPRQLAEPVPAPSLPGHDYV